MAILEHAEWRRQAFALVNSSAPEQMRRLAEQIEQAVPAAAGALNGAVLPASVSSPALAGYVTNALKPSISSELQQTYQLRRGAEAIRTHSGDLHDWQKLVRDNLWRLTAYEAQLSRYASIGTPAAWQMAAPIIQKRNAAVEEIVKALIAKSNAEQRLRETMTRVTPAPRTAVSPRSPSGVGDRSTGTRPAVAVPATGPPGPTPGMARSSPGDSSAPTGTIPPGPEEGTTARAPGLAIGIVNAGFSGISSLWMNEKRPPELRIPRGQFAWQALGSSSRTFSRFFILGSVNFSADVWTNALLKGAAGGAVNTASNELMKKYVNPTVAGLTDGHPRLDTANIGLATIELPSLPDPLRLQPGNVAFNGLLPMTLNVGALGPVGLTPDQVGSLHTGAPTRQDFGGALAQQFTADAPSTPLPRGWEGGQLPTRGELVTGDVSLAPSEVQRKVGEINNLAGIKGNLYQAIYGTLGNQVLLQFGLADSVPARMVLDGLVNAASNGFPSLGGNQRFLPNDFIIPGVTAFAASGVVYTLLENAPAPVQQAVAQMCPEETGSFGDAVKQVFCAVGGNGNPSSPPTQGNDDNTASGGPGRGHGPLALETSPPAGSSAVSVGPAPAPAPEHAAGTVTTRLAGAGEGSHAGRVAMTYHSDGSVSVGVDSTQVDRNGTSTLFTPVPPGAQQQQWNLDPDARTNYAAVLPAGHDPGNPGSWPVAERTVRYESETTTLVGDGRPDTLEGWVMRAPDASNHQKEDIFVVPAQRTNPDGSTTYFVPVPDGYPVPTPQQLAAGVSVEYQDAPVNAHLRYPVVNSPAPQMPDPMTGYEPVPAYKPPPGYDATVHPPAVTAPPPAPAQPQPHPVSQPAPPVPAPHQPSLQEQAADMWRRAQEAAGEAAGEATRRFNNAADEAARQWEEQFDRMKENGQLAVPGRAAPVPLQYQRVR